ncbi:MAG: DUF368 domain-containing protein [Acidimicrobiia bacterium]|nr:DUF368 domain-containing protein [Acidimicrobiia bacterium]MDH5504896.1 DUF368 domain-containing protein [Acidimicrobiia bacterium]
MSDAEESRIPVVVTGFVMGAADLVPGVSGGTIALVFGIYDRLLAAITSFNVTNLRGLLKGRVKDFARATSLSFVLTLGLGMGTAIVALSEPLGRLLDDADGRVVLFAFFFGLVIASVYVIGRRVSWTTQTRISFVLGAIAGLVIVRLTPTSGSTAPLALFAAGAIAICAMVLPGISGSFILVILGQYDNVLDAVRERNIGTVLIFGAGTVLGLAFFARLLQRLLARHHDLTMAVLAGFMAGSLWKIWPWRICLTLGPDGHCLTDALSTPTLDRYALLGVILALIGAGVVVLVDHLGRAPNRSA